ncbi:hypothetical protein [Pelagibius sp. Alg239-R121]|uniref:hypothetical protein n=1 Tax=Pelagibius sp. Alg239-R121 TaxID=2993448 RepID=UPI0024A78416|nr:hypothetical protein [Pelagibius sp. Alg239-R121]
MFEVKRFAPILAVFALGAAVAACDDPSQQQQSEVPALEQVPDAQSSQDPAVPKE